MISRSLVEVCVPIPGTVAVIRVDPGVPEFGDTIMNFGTKVTPL